MDDPADFLDLPPSPPLPIESLAEQRARHRRWLRYFPTLRSAGD